MDIALWMVQVLLALAFAFSGFMKVARPIESLRPMMNWVDTFPPRVVRAIGMIEILGAIGLLLPALTGVLPWLTPLAATGLALTMIGGFTLHVSRNELSLTAPNVVLFLLALFVVVGRFVILPL